MGQSKQTWTLTFLNIVVQEDVPVPVTITAYSDKSFTYVSNPLPISSR